LKADSVGLGHALDATHAPGGGAYAPLPFVVDLATGAARLEARPPSNPEAVHRAEEILKARPRPVYAYLGDLHPYLGRVGLIFDRKWAERSLQGLTRCDSGGLAECLGGFCFLGKDEAAEALVDLSTPATCPLSSWPAQFADEIEKSYSEGVEHYVHGHPPETRDWTDQRKHCIESIKSQGGELDRRLWTWEARMHQPPIREDLQVVVLSHEAFKRLESLRRQGSELPETVRLIVGVAGKADTKDWFHLKEVRQALGGEE
jgi:hypothetical protein